MHNDPGNLNDPWWMGKGLEAWAQEDKLVGLSTFAYPQFKEQQILDALAKCAISAWCVPARCGMMGYIAIVVHPADVGLMKRQISQSYHYTLQTHLGGFKFMKLGLSDFPKGFEPILDNYDRVREAKRAKEECSILEQIVIGTDDEQDGKGRSGKTRSVSRI